jgi:hypothetical protein
MKPSLPLLMLAAGATLAHADESMRCGKWIVNSEMSAHELLSKCGEPTSKQSETSDVRARYANGNGTFVVGQSTTEWWYYDRGSRAFTMVVTLLDGKIKSIDKAE